MTHGTPQTNSPEETEADVQWTIDNYASIMADQSESPIATSQYRGVDATTLRHLLGAQCSPQAGKQGYVIGPDITGRICHCATCSSMGDAIATAARMNGRATS